MKIATERDYMAQKASAAKATSALDRLSNEDPTSSRKQAFLIVAVLSLFAGVLLLKYEEVAEFLGRHEEDVNLKPQRPTEIDQPGGGGGGLLGGLFGGDVDNNANTDAAVDGSGGGGNGLFSGLFGGGGGKAPGGAMSAQDLLASARAGRHAMNEYFRADYGTFADQIFNKTTIMKTFTRPSEISDNRLKRRVKIKMIEAQLGITGGRENGMPSFTWVTGGHSASAAHGNLLSQSYTAAVGRAAKIAFDSVGVDFVAKHRAMGGTHSGPEIALCNEALFGQDIDVLMWDYGMTDGREQWTYWLWANRAGSHPTFPTLVAYNERFRELHQKLEKIGQAAYELDGLPMVRSKLFPDSATHPNAASLPRAVAYYMCGTAYEKGEPCDSHKWATNPPCTGHKYQTSWHNGWKDHLLIGSVSAALLGFMLEDAASDLVNREAMDPDAGPSISAEYLAQLKSEEEADRRAFLNSSLPTDRGRSNAEIADELWEAFYRGHPVCHNARLPSDARFSGLFTNSRRISPHIEHGYHEGYEIGYSSEKAMPEPEPDNEATPPALTVLSPRLDCTVPLEHDYKDGIIVREADGWMTDIYPNDAEAEILNLPYPDAEKAKRGYVVMCTVGCDWNRCPPGFVYLNEVKGSSGNLTITIDGQEVKDTVSFAPDCFVMKGASGYSFGQGTKDGRKGQYEMKFKVGKSGGKLLLSAVIVV